jgi:hypothetical protein
MLSPEPNPKMDELLKAYAKKRREQGEPPLEMHPATRRFLQDEVKRTLRVAPGRPPLSWRKLRWPLLALGSGFAALLVMFAMIYAQMQHLMPASASVDRSLSEAKPMLKAPARVAEPAASPAMAASKAQAKQEDFKQDPTPPVAAAGSVNTIAAASPEAGGGKIGDSQALVPPEGQIAAPGQPSSSGYANNATLAASAPAPAADKSIAVAPAAEAQSNVAIAPTAPTPGAVAKEASAQGTPSPLAASYASREAAGEFVPAQKFSQQPAAPPLSNVLSVFNLQRDGQNVRVVDADGSVYEGQVVGVNSRALASARPADRARFGAAKKDQDLNQGTNWAFKVTGTNNRLQQNVVFTGNVLTMPTNVQFPLESARSQNQGAPQLQNAPASARVVPAQNSRVTGKVQVGDGKEIPIEARPPNP